MQILIILLAVLFLPIAAMAQSPLAPLNNLFSSLTGQPSTDSQQSASNPVDLSREHGVHDIACEAGLVDSFELTDNFSKILQASATTGLTGFLGSIASGGRPGTGDMVKAAKLAARNMNWLPMSLERQLGDNLHAEETPLISRDSRKALDREYYASADRLLEKVLTAIPAHPYEFRLHVIDSSGRNAKALPGGYLYIERGTLPTKRDKGKDKAEKEQAALFTLSHEIAHVLRRHETREIQNRIVDTVDTVSALSNLFKTTGPNPEMVLGAVGYMKKLHESYSPDQEKQADACAIRLLAGLDRNEAHKAFNAFLNTMPEAQPGNLSHPKLQDRLQHGSRVFASLTR